MDFELPWLPNVNSSSNFYNYKLDPLFPSVYIPCLAFLWCKVRYYISQNEVGTYTYRGFVNSTKADSYKQAVLTGLFLLPRRPNNLRNSPEIFWIRLTWDSLRRQCWQSCVDHHNILTSVLKDLLAKLPNILLSPCHNNQVI